MKRYIDQSQLIDAVERGLEKTGSFILLSQLSGIHPNTLRNWHELKQVPRIGRFLRFKQLVDQLSA